MIIRRLASQFGSRPTEVLKWRIVEQFLCRFEVPLLGIITPYYLSNDSLDFPYIVDPIIISTLGLSYLLPTVYFSPEGVIQPKPTPGSRNGSDLLPVKILPIPI